MKMLAKILRLLRLSPQLEIYGYSNYKNDPAIDTARKAKWDSELVPLLQHRNGYVREAAVERTAKLLLPTLLPFLMPRINDWVPEIRTAAHAAVDAYIAADKFDDFLRALPSVYWLRKCSRTDHEPFIQRIEQFLANHSRKGEIAPRIALLSDIYARSHFDLALKYNLADTTELINYGLQSSDFPTLRNACRMIDRLPVTERLSFGRKLLQQKTGWLLVEGLRLVALNDAKAAREVALQHVMSGYSPLREFAERLSGLTKEELSIRRHKVLSDAHPSTNDALVAIRLSGSLKDKSAEALAERFINHVNPKLRGAAILALTRLSPEKFTPLVIPGLDDTARAVNRDAAIAFQELKLVMTPAEWAARADGSRSESHFLRIAGLARMTNKWDHLGLLLEYSVREKFPAAVARELGVWCWQFNNSFVPATSAQHAWISASLAKYKGKSPSASELFFYCR
ncbi:MAG: hypothetical protein JNM12_11945 [Alphaproteobacteria bacterium]|nr:hypothetical protein [Alphaproteobacteria bacterium]